MAYTYTHRHRVRYRECDPMGVVYHTHFLDYFEAARTEALRDLGVAYRELENDGIIMPVIEASIQYKGSARYDDLLEIDAHFPSMPTVRVRITYDVRREGEGSVLASGQTDLCFVNAENRRPVRLPDRVRDAFEPVMTE